MNTINTVGDLIKTLSVYDSSLPFSLEMIYGTAKTGPVRGTLNNDNMICHEIRVNANFDHLPGRVVISAIADVGT